MNEKIKELALELVEHCDWNPPHDPEYYTFAAEDLEKFAELIVRECVEYYRSQIGETSEPHTKTLEHFGVE